MTLTLPEISEKIHQILWGKSFVDVVDETGIEHTFILRSLSIHEQNEVKYIRRKELALCRNMGVLCEDDLKELYHAQGLWTPQHESEIDDMRLAISRVGSQLRNAEFLRSKKNKLKKVQREYQTKLKELLDTQYRLFVLSAENRADEVARRHMVFMATQNPDGTQFWPSKTAFDEYEDTTLLFNLAKAYYRENQLTETQVRAIARSGEWRFRWRASKNGESLFGRPIADWSEVQNALVFWSQYYDSVYDSYERPPNHIIEDDAACDAWVEDQNKKANAANRGQRRDRSALGNRSASKAKDHQEVFLMVQPGDQGTIKEVQEMNPSVIRAKLRQEHEQIKNAGGKRIKEWNLGTRARETPHNVIRKGRKR